MEYVNLFQTLRDQKMCPTVMSLIMHMYVNQKILIRWNQLMSQTCAIIEIMLLISVMQCINVPTICCQMWHFNDKKHLKSIHVAWRKCIRRIWKLNSENHNDLLHHINTCLPKRLKQEYFRAA